jgi:hypothetical protein
MISMEFMVLQKGAEPPTIEQLKRAFGAVPGLLAPDALAFCKETFGAIVRGFSQAQAQALQAGLKAEGVETEIIEHSQFPALPVTKTIRRLECAPEGLMIYDPYGRKFPVEWGQVMLIAAGSVRQATFERKRTELVETKIKLVHGLIPIPEKKVTVGFSTQEGEAETTCLEIVLTRGVAQYSIEAKGFNYTYLGERVTQNPAANFALLLRDLVKYAPGAKLNRGVTAMLTEPPASVRYLHKNSLQDEIQWMLWRLKGGAV